ncbi:MAG TPA: MFS transporter [Acidimicrobiales bacterium]|nr:MFS transporter [Acidimicrobiales bacterium]
MAELDRKWWTLIAVCTATFMLLLDITVVNVALPDIQRSLHASFSDLQWVVDAYSLTLAAFLLTAGVVGDMFGRRLVFASGLTLFTLSSLVCGLSTSSLMLNLARGVQGVGGAIMFATSLALIAAAFQGRERGTAFGVYGAVIGAAVAVGPLIGGALTSGLGWRWIFFVNVPVGVAAVAITLTRVRESKEPTHRRIDWVGLVSFSAALFMLVFALVRGNASGWGSTSIVSLLVGAGALLVVFVVAERRGSDPMLDLGLFKKPAVVGSSIVAITLSGSIFALFLYITLFVQDALGYGPFAAGLRFLPITMLSFLVAPVAGKLSVRVPSRFLLGGGLVLVAVGLFLMSHVHATSGWTALLPGFIVTGAGIGTINPVLAAAAIGVVQPEHSGMASGANNTFRQVGIATGIAGLGAVFQSQIQHSTATALRASAIGQEILARGGSQLNAALAGGGVRQVAAAIPSAAARSTLLSAYRMSFASTFDHLMLIGTVVAGFGAVCAFALVRQRDFVPSYSPAQAHLEQPAMA